MQTTLQAPNTDNFSHRGSYLRFPFISIIVAGSLINFISLSPFSHGGTKVNGVQIAQSAGAVDSFSHSADPITADRSLTKRRRSNQNETTPLQTGIESTTRNRRATRTPRAERRVAVCHASATIRSICCLEEHPPSEALRKNR